MAHSRRHKRRHDEHEEHENEERWLVSYADMMTLLFCLFMVLFAISSVNTSKFQALQRALQDAFSGKILSGGHAIVTTGNDRDPNRAQATPPLESIAAAAIQPPSESSAQDLTTQRAAAIAAQAKAAAREDEAFRALKRRIDALARREGIAAHVKTSIRPDGLTIELLTDDVFFDSGSAVLKTPAQSLLSKVAAIIASEHEHPVLVEGHTDSQPIHTARYRSNWALSGDRAAAVVDDLAAGGVLPRRLSLRGYGAQDPIATNSTPQGRSRNRRVDVVLTRLHRQP